MRASGMACRGGVFDEMYAKNASGCTLPGRVIVQTRTKELPLSILAPGQAFQG